MAKKTHYKSHKTHSKISYIEIVVFITIVGILMAISIPKFFKTIENSQRSEASNRIAMIYRSATTYFEEEQTHIEERNSKRMSQFPDSIGPSPGVCTICNKNRSKRCIPGKGGGDSYDVQEVWEQPTWKSLDFSISEPHFFVYTFLSENTLENGGKGSFFTARAQADLDHDGTCSTFERIGTIDENGRVKSSRGMYVRLSTE